MSTSTKTSQAEATSPRAAKRSCVSTLKQQASPKRQTASKCQPATKLLNLIPSRNTTKGKLYICGTGDCEQLGKPENVIELRRPAMLDLSGRNFVDIACGGLHTLALTEEGELYSWGCNDEGALGRVSEEFLPGVVTFKDNIDIVQLAAGDSFSAVLTSTGEIYIWGAFRTSTGLLGFVNQPDVKQTTPVKLVPSGAPVQFTKLAAGNNHLLALTTVGTIYAVGDNEAGQLGLRMSPRKFGPTQGLYPFSLHLKDIIDIAAGGYHSFATSKTGKVYAWGQNNFYQCGVPMSASEAEVKLSAPTFSKCLSGLSPIQTIAAGEHHTLILTSNSSLYGIGRSDSHQLGVELSDVWTSSKTAVKEPQLIPGIAPLDIASGSNHCLAIEDDRTLSWGYGESYALGHDIDADEAVPTVIESLSGRKVIKVSAGGHHSVFLVQL
ncbi:hypothetical protein DSO57_1037777 [Entomophthora muscae]|uniref:Uncharacterized protein n=1 Tax=Entomophthora muscae TaxID=34485 RepID=A0ACC2TXD0_9FUNG|nr:hypothetical protein DSO57_1037777 [Entomophthora muscae]